MAEEEISVELILLIETVVSEIPQRLIKGNSVGLIKAKDQIIVFIIQKEMWVDLFPPIKQHQ